MNYILCMLLCFVLHITHEIPGWGGGWALKPFRLKTYKPNIMIVTIDLLESMNRIEPHCKIKYRS